MFQKLLEMKNGDFNPVGNIFTLIIFTLKNKQTFGLEEIIHKLCVKTLRAPCREGEGGEPPTVPPQRSHTSQAAKLSPALGPCHSMLHRFMVSSEMPQIPPASSEF